MSVNVSNVCAIVLAAGFGQRMKMRYQKQYCVIGNKTILEYAVEVFLLQPRVARIIVVLCPDDTYFSTLPLAHNSKITVVKGGKDRIDSVLAGIQAATDARWLLIHDGVRPCLHQADLERLLSISETNCIGGVLATPVRDTIKRTITGKSVIACTVDRIGLWHALTPQLFPRKLLYDCLICALNAGVTVTDEASALEYCGFHPKLIQGRSDNIKVTYPEDLQLAECYLSRIVSRKRV